MQSKHTSTYGLDFFEEKGAFSSLLAFPASNSALQRLQLRQWLQASPAGAFNRGRASQHDEADTTWKSDAGVFHVRGRR